MERKDAESVRHRILVVAAHPDDEVLGCGGTIARHADEGDEVKILILAEGATSRQSKRDRGVVKDELLQLSKAAEKSSEILGATRIELLDFPDNRLDSLDRLDLIKTIEERIDIYNPDTIYVHHSGDVNVDHRRLHEAVVTASRPIPGSRIRQILSYEVASSTEWQTPGSAASFCPNWFVDITEQWSRKKKALEEYSSEMREWPHPRSIRSVEHQARLRGSQVGVEAAEAFCLLRRIW